MTIHKVRNMLKRIINVLENYEDDDIQRVERKELDQGGTTAFYYGHNGNWKIKEFDMASNNTQMIRKMADKIDDLELKDGVLVVSLNNDNVQLYDHLKHGVKFYR